MDNRNKKNGFNHHRKSHENHSNHKFSISELFKRIFKNLNPNQLNFQIRKGSLKHHAYLEEWRLSLEDTVRSLQSRIIGNSINLFSNADRQHYLKEIQSIWISSKNLFELDKEHIFKNEKLVIAHLSVKAANLYKNLLKPSQEKTIEKAELCSDHLSLIEKKLKEEVGN
ncbi:MAG: hypothetical protein MK033_08775 [Candidatus Caenarcaniphilales bacterium]|nr:hypothetical protein [Candidatus Caenarcaniphilales bacterium]